MEMNCGSDDSFSRSSSPELPPLPSPTTNKGGSNTLFKNKKTFFTTKAKEIDLTKLPRLEDSQWNNKKAMNSLRKPAVNTPENFTSDFSNFSSDPFTSSVFTAGQLTKKSKPVVEIRKRSSMASPTTEYSHSKAIKITPPSEKPEKAYNLYETAVNDCRDLLVTAYNLTDDRLRKTELLDLLEIFRSYTETGKIRLPARNPLAKDKKKFIKFDGWKDYDSANHESENGTLQINEMTNNSSQPSEPSPREEYPLLPKASAQPNTSVAHKSLWKPAPSTRGVLNNTQTKKKAANTAQYKTNIEQDRANKILTIITTKNGNELPQYNATNVRDKINKLMGKIAIARVHTSPNKNIVLTCHNSTPDELLTKREVWRSVIAGWSVDDIQKINHWPKLVVHGVPTNLTFPEFKREVAEFNPLVNIEGEPRWLTKSQKKSHASVVISVRNENQKHQLRKSGLLVSGLLLKVVNYQSSTSKSQCRKCLKFGHQAPLCNKAAICGYCAGKHLTFNHSCNVCKSSSPCIHTPKKCANCQSSTHTAFEREHCEYVKALSC